jgi:kynurenine formamidase
MFIDITLKIIPKMIADAHKNDEKALPGHLGTHFDVMNKEFPLDYVERKAIVFDVSKIYNNRDISVDDIPLEKIESDMFVAFYSGFIEKIGYGGKKYFNEHPQLSHKLIEELIKKNISIIGIDFAGIRRGDEHPHKDQYCADRGIFI